MGDFVKNLPPDVTDKIDTLYRFGISLDARLARIESDIASIKLSIDDAPDAAEAVALFPPIEGNPNDR